MVRSPVILLGVLVGGSAVSCGPDGASRTTARKAARPAARSSQPPSATPDRSLKATLGQVARCFHGAVTALQSEPKPGRLGPFLKRALATGRAPAACQAVRFARSEANAVVVRVGGCDVGFERLVLGEDYYSGGRTALHIRYRFRCPGGSTWADTTIERQFGAHP